MNSRASGVWLYKCFSVHMRADQELIQACIYYVYGDSLFGESEEKSIFLSLNYHIIHVRIKVVAYTEGYISITLLVLRALSDVMHYELRHVKVYTNSKMAKKSENFVY